ncbi:MAG: hypothetical protein H0V93_15930 [Euzebyales bacterium]|nr:hypothetical protein [Euzebyales bacterium]
MTDRRDPLEWLEVERRQPGGSRVAFQQQLEDCNEMLVTSGDMVATQINPVTRAFLEADQHRAQEWVDTSDRVEAICRDLEEACYLVLARQSPVAGDLRRVVATLRCVADVSRSSNLLTHVAQSLTWVHPPSFDADVRGTIAQLGEASATIFHAAVAAWRDHDALAAVELQRTDDEVDLLQKVLLTEIYTGRTSVEESVSLALLARYYERIADHAVEMAREVTYFLTGDRVTDGAGA